MLFRSRIKIFDRFHEAHVPFLNEIEEVFKGPLVSPGDHHYQTEIGGNELVGGLKITKLFIFDGYAVLFLSTQDRGAADFHQLSRKGVEGDKGLLGRSLFFGKIDIFKEVGLVRSALLYRIVILVSHRKVHVPAQPPKENLPLFRGLFNQTDKEARGNRDKRKQ